MSIWRRMLSLIGLRPISAPRKYTISEPLQITLTTLAQYEGRPENDLLQDLLAAGLTEYYSSDERWKKWGSLSPRERDVAALACLGFSNKQIAARLSISPETVKTHLHNALTKFGLHSRSELNLIMRDWDFSAWE